ncbi:hypothetical protein DCS_01274 [Drechmeria coniospora]|uniref:Uncharacterized protein n=1 Tax=Drechmeria coniospora TaxID=98403 RepID=A0A151GSP9_DRECN|nr:hypothetical protein DCS_01274 [Drechmeria coniospora]KYK60139.1 hypothetical protein DCS_01274 [Drechmeria coniospora]
MTESESRAQEVLVVAISVLFLALLLVSIVAYNVKSKDNHGQGNDSWREMWGFQEGPAAVIQSLQRQSFMESVRRRSITLAENLQLELMSLKRKLSWRPSMAESVPVADLSVANTLQRFTLDSGDTKAESQAVGNGSRWRISQDSLALITGRESVWADKRRRSTWVACESEEESCDLEAQASTDSA